MVGEVFGRQVLVKSEIPIFRADFNKFQGQLDLSHCFNLLQVPQHYFTGRLATKSNQLAAIIYKIIIEIINADSILYRSLSE